jgi:hypothetical protein
MEINRRAYEGVEDILATGGSPGRIRRLIARRTDHLRYLRKTGMIDAYTTNSPLSLLLTYRGARRRGPAGPTVTSAERTYRHPVH